jgi:hypothetical protein
MEIKMNVCSYLKVNGNVSINCEIMPRMKNDAQCEETAIYHCLPLAFLVLVEFFLRKIIHANSAIKNIPYTEICVYLLGAPL